MAQAAQAYAVCEGLDPSGRATPHSMALAGPAFRVEADTGQATYTLGAVGDCCWVFAAAGSGHGMTEIGLAVIEQQARAAGFCFVGFQTMRPGLVRRAKAAGYGIAGRVGNGYTLKKRIA